MFLQKLREHQIFLNLHAIFMAFCWDLLSVVDYCSKRFYSIPIVQAAKRSFFSFLVFILLVISFVVFYEFCLVIN